MAENGLYLVTPRWNDGQTEYSTGIWYEQTNADQGDESADQLANQWWDDFIDPGAEFPTIVVSTGAFNSVYCRHIPAFGAPQIEFPGLTNKVRKAGLGGSAPLGGQNALKIRVTAPIGAGGAAVHNYMSISGIDEGALVDGAWSAGFLNGPVQAMMDKLALPITTADGTQFRIVVTKDPRGAGRAFAAPVSIKTTPTVLNQRRRQNERIGLEP